MRLCDNWCRAVLAAMGDDTGDPDAAIIKAAIIKAAMSEDGSGKQKVEKLLRAGGVSVDVESESDRKTPLALVSERLGRRIEQGVAGDRSRNLSREESLRLAAEDTALAALLISWGAKDSVVLAAKRGDLEAVQGLLDSGVVSVTTSEWRVLHDYLGPRKTLALLLGQGGSVDIQAQAADLYDDLAKANSPKSAADPAPERQRTVYDDLAKAIPKNLAKDRPPDWVLAVAAELDEEHVGKMVAGLTMPQVPSMLRAEYLTDEILSLEADKLHVKDKVERLLKMQRAVGAFSTLVQWMEATYDRTHTLRSVDPRSADAHADLFVRLQLATAAFLENLPGDVSDMADTEVTDLKVRQLLKHPECARGLNAALRVSAKELFAQPVMQRYVEHLWLGSALEYELKKMRTSWKKVFSLGGMWRRTKLVLLLLVNLLLLPVVALVPPLDTMLKEMDEATLKRTLERKLELAEAQIKAAGAKKGAKALEKVATAKALKEDGDLGESSLSSTSINLSNRMGGKQQFYLLQLPLVKFYLGFIAQLALALIFTLLSAATMHTTTTVSLLLLWVAGGIAWEAKQSKGDMREHFADYFNRYDLVALLLCTASLLMAAATLRNGESTEFHGEVQRPGEHWASTRAIAILFLWLRTLRLLLVSPTFGPYALMFNRMLFNNVLYFIVLLSFVLVGIGAAWYALLESTTYGYIGQSDPVEPWREYSPVALLDAEGCTDELGGIDLLTIMFRLLEGALTGSDLFDCARSSTEAPFASWLLSFFFVLLTVILLINMLIAMCAAPAPRTPAHIVVVTCRTFAGTG